METVEWPQASSLDMLTAQAEEFNFYQAIRMLESSTDQHGKRFDISYEAVNTQAFKPNFIDDIEIDKHHRKAKVSVNGFSIAGQQGPLPDVFAELLQREKNSGNKGPDAFINLFNNRLIKLLYDIKKQLNPMLFNDSVENSNTYDMLSAIAGHQTMEVYDRLPLCPEQLLSFASLLVGNRQNYSVLKNILETVFDCELEIEPCVGAWKKLPERYRTKLGDSTAILGSGVGLGKHFWDNQAAIGLKMRVRSIEYCHKLMPNGSLHNILASMLSMLTDGLYQINVELELNWETIPLSDFSNGIPMYLGHSSWLRGRVSLKTGMRLGDLPQENVSTEKRDRESLYQQEVYKHFGMNTPGFTVHPSLEHKFGSFAL
ncbi:type VI secretion system baseplate subunit TssG [Paraneptunicella aestuarii]|uniref:type VI secretion system baseplate subunit TssG n=1 Tax=Paraneptunicella aestuarii TaxID=2831148 RepID=UPI001E5E7AA2|nr:type VI secretion system baseplate subunit TssG [Paraneptunicella aestuarii]UAA40645.1 type VI secretion system baseplate subunit TssG [Paraneptunicella aestuarii]